MFSMKRLFMFLKNTTSPFQIDSTGIGVIVTIQDNIILVEGLQKVGVGELVNLKEPFDSSIQGYVMNIENSVVKIVLIKGSQKDLSQGQFVYRTFLRPTTKAGFGVLGQILTPLGVVLNNSDYGLGELVKVQLYSTAIVPIFQSSPGIMLRDPVARPFMTGITAIDCFLPIGCGQRELIIGDNNTGKTALAVTIILNQSQITLLLRRPPGREAYPGDIFFIHSRLLERSAQINRKLSGGSLTALPIVETKGGDISGYIPTNVISITDGQVFLSSRLFNEGFRPAIDLGLSVSRVGSKAQYDCMKLVCKKVKADYSMYKAYASLAKVSSDIDARLLRFI